MIFLADDVTAIKSRMREIRVEEGRGDDDWHTATANDLDALAGRYGLARKDRESDYALRQRIAGVVGA